MRRLKNSVRPITLTFTVAAATLLIAPAWSPEIGDGLMKMFLPEKAKLVQSMEKTDAAGAVFAGAPSGASPSSSGDSVVHGRISGVLDPAFGGRGSSGASPLDRQFGHLVASVLEAARRRGEVAPFGAVRRKFVTLSSPATNNLHQETMLDSAFGETMEELDDQQAEGFESAFPGSTSPDAERRRALAASFLAAMDTTPPGGSPAGLGFCVVAISVNPVPIDGGLGAPGVVWTAPTGNLVASPATPGASPTMAWYGLAAVAPPASASYTAWSGNSLISTGPLNPVRAPNWNNYAPSPRTVRQGSVSSGGSSRAVSVATPSATAPTAVSQSLAVVSQSRIVMSPSPVVAAPASGRTAATTSSLVWVDPTLASFNGTGAGTNGQNPKGSLLLIGSTLYGTTESGGPNNDGTVFSVPVTGGTPTVLATFDGTHGANPFGSLILISGTLYGTTSAGGTNSDGAIFSLPVGGVAGGGAPTLLASFNGTNGTGPLGSLILSGSTLYGTASEAGANGGGTVFSVTLTGTLTRLASFDAAHGQVPTGSLLLSGGKLYGTTEAGGPFGFGVVFSLPVAGGTPTVLAAFNPASSGPSNPKGSLILVGSTLYGTSQGGGAHDDGTVFSLPITGEPLEGLPTVIASFNTADTNGSFPDGSLTLSGDGTTFYGTTSGDGFATQGTVFSLPLAGGTPTGIDVFTGASGGGESPLGDVTLSSDGTTLYGTTEAGGVNGEGTVFSLSLVPEPSTWMMTACGIALLGLTRRRSARGA